MNRRLFIGILFVVFGLEVISYLFFSRLNEQGYIPNVFSYIKIIALFSLLFKSVFYFIVIHFQGHQKRYLLYSIFSISTLISYFFLYTYWMEHSGSTNVLYADLSIVFAIASLVVGFYVVIDQSTKRFIKAFLIINSVLLIIYKTPVYFVFYRVLFEFFGTRRADYEDIYVIALIVEYFVFGIWTIFQSLIIRKIDYI